ncbi:DUF1476 domain-containing protein [Tropicimonas sp.]|uniref:DUF1476 domain-containing protein n=1 Tax=Tropicimonas sp. TaxID=2067044 RepID=UPI003A87EB57
MTTFDDREAAYEAQFVHAAEQEFMAQSARNKQIGYWAAAIMGQSPEEAVRYAKDIIRTDLEQGGQEAVIRKLVKDLGGLRDEARIRERMNDFLIEARAKARDGKIKTLL